MKRCSCVLKWTNAEILIRNYGLNHSSKCGKARSALQRKQIYRHGLFKEQILFCDVLINPFDLILPLVI